MRGKNGAGWRKAGRWKEPRMGMTALEERVAHLIRMVEDLSEVVARQDREIDALTRRVAMLMEREAGREAQERAPPIDKPPHY
jgi:SlyX protein